MAAKVQGFDAFDMNAYEYPYIYEKDLLAGDDLETGRMISTPC